MGSGVTDMNPSVGYNLGLLMISPAQWSRWNVNDGHTAEILVLADFVTVLRELGVLPVLPAAPP